MKSIAVLFSNYLSASIDQPDTICMVGYVVADPVAVDFDQFIKRVAQQRLIGGQYGDIDYDEEPISIRKMDSSEAMVRYDGDEYELPVDVNEKDVHRFEVVFEGCETMYIVLVMLNVEPY